MWSKVEPSENKLISYAGVLPSRLYRYRTITQDNLPRRINFEIIEEAIHLAGLKDLNDPDEGRFLLKWQRDYDSILEYWRRALRSTRPRWSTTKIEKEAMLRTEEVVRSGYVVPKDVIDSHREILNHILRVACFTTQPVNYSMWANYAKFIDPDNGPIDHGGICLEYRCDERWRDTTLHPVEYSDDVPVIDIVKRDESEQVRALYMKSTEWRCEDEWRIGYVLGSMPPFADNLTVNSKIKFENSLMAVIFGLKTPTKIIEEIRDRVSAVKPEVRYQKVVHDPQTYQRGLADLC